MFTMIEILVGCSLIMVALQSAIAVLLFHILDELREANDASRV